MLLQWETFTAQPQGRIARWLAGPDETDMVELFADFISAVDSPSDDLPLLLSSPFTSIHTYSQLLLEELATFIKLWNQTPRSSEQIPADPIHWTPDVTSVANDNPAQSFVAQFNALAEFLQPPEGCFLVAVLQPSSLSDAKAMNRWLSQAIQAGISPKVRLMLTDYSGLHLFKHVAAGKPGQVVTLHPGLNMPEAVRQLAAAGDPADPGTQFRQAYVALSEAISKRDGKQTKGQADTCLAIARKQQPVQPHWYSMEITVLSALANDQIGYQDYEKALAYARQGVLVARQAQSKIPELLISDRLLAQALMLHAGLCVVVKDWNKAWEAYGEAADCLAAVQDDLLTMEALRMAGYAANKAGESKIAIAFLIRALQHGDRLPPAVAANSTYPGVVEQLLPMHYTPFISLDQLEAMVSKQLGENWPERVNQWRSITREPTPILDQA
jgi:tetratricopeptide (TPR) repeat protein